MKMSAIVFSLILAACLAGRARSESEAPAPTIAANEKGLTSINYREQELLASGEMSVEYAELRSGDTAAIADLADSQLTCQVDVGAPLRSLTITRRYKWCAI